MDRFVVLLASALLLAACSQPPPEPASEPAAQTLSIDSVIQVADPKATAQLLKGFHVVEQGSWRWTEKHFSVALKPPIPGKPATLLLRFSIPDAVLKRLQTVTLGATVGGVALPSQTYTQAGAQVYTQSVPASALSGEKVQVDFALDKALAPDENDRRELGVVVSSVGLE